MMKMKTTLIAKVKKTTSDEDDESEATKLMKENAMIAKKVMQKRAKRVMKKKAIQRKKAALKAVEDGKLAACLGPVPGLGVWALRVSQPAERCSGHGAVS